MQQLFPTHKWGTADNVAWRNIHEPLVGVEVAPRPKVRATVQLRDLWLASRQDALYSFTGAVLARNPNASSSHVGEEIDFNVGYRFSSKLEILAGYGHLFKSSYLEQSTPTHSENVSYLMWTYKL